MRWKKAALENCPGVPCPIFSVPGPCSSITATPTGPSSASVSFVPPTSDGGSAITGYIVTATSTPSAPAKRKSSAIITVTGTSSPIVVTGLTFGVNYIFSVVATNAAGGSPTVTTTTTVTPCTLNTAGTASSSPTLAVNTLLTNITHSTTLATGIGTATGLPSGVTASWSANVITISGTPTATTMGTQNYSIPLTGGCGSVNATGTITVNPVCPTATITDNDMNTYNTVAIGTQCWTKENLKVTMYNDNTSIPLVTSGTWAATTGAYAIYDNQASSGTNATNYGFLYNWYAAAGIVTSSGAPTKNICRSGWHVPTDSDWNKLVKFIDSSADTTISGTQSTSAGNLLKKDDAFLWTTNTGTNTSGFSVLPGGARLADGSFTNLRSGAFFWSATQSGGSTSWGRGLTDLTGAVLRDNAYKSFGGSVRCLRD